MHQSSLDKMTHFVNNYMQSMRGQNINILDLGSLDVNGSYRYLFDDAGWSYLGADMAEGKNVDVVLKNPYLWNEIKSDTQDVFVCGQVFEHVAFFWIVMDEIARVLKPDGLACIIAPSRGYEHRYPVDCWRFYPDGFRVLARYSGLQLLSVETQWHREGYENDDSDDWGDTVAIFVKPKHCSLKFKLLLKLRRWFHRLNLIPLLKDVS